VCAVAVSALVALSHRAIGDGPVIKVQPRDIKPASNPAVGLSIAVDQGFSILCLLCATLAAV
jgi:hypothetical protein